MTIMACLFQKINKFSRKNDYLIRWGGEEFIMLLQVESEQGLYRALEHTKTIIEQHYFEEVKKEFDIEFLV